MYYLIDCTTNHNISTPQHLNCGTPPDTIFAFLTAQNCELSARRGLWLEIREF